MNVADVIKLLESNQNERGIKHWQAMENPLSLSSYGIGLTQLRKLAKQVGKDHELAKELWRSDCYDARVIGLLIDEPKLISREQAEQQVEELNAGMLCHIFSSCDAPLAKSPIAFETASDWLESKDETRRRCGNGLIYELSKNKRLKELTDDFFLSCIDRIDNTIDDEVNLVKLSQGGALIGIGKRNKTLNTAAIKVAKRVGPIHYSDGDRKCDPLDVLKHLTSDYLKEKFSK